MCSLVEPYGTLNLAGDMEKLSGSCVAQGPSPDTMLVTVSSSSVALLKVEDVRPCRSWFSHPSIPFTAAAVYDNKANKIVAASKQKVLCWNNAEKSTPTQLIECPSDILCIRPFCGGTAAICRNGISFQIQHETPNWKVQTESPVRGTFCWADVIDSKVVLLSEDGRSVTTYPLDEPTAKEVVKLPKAPAVSCAVHNGSLYAITSQGKVFVLKKQFTPTKIELKMEPNEKVSMASCGEDLLIITSNKATIWNVNFGLVKTSRKLPFSGWANKCIVLESKAMLVCGSSRSLMIMPVKMQSWSLAALVGSRTKSDKKNSACGDLCSALSPHVSSWTINEMSKHLQGIDDLSEELVVKCCKRLVSLGEHEVKGSPVLNKLLHAPHDCTKLTSELHTGLSLDDVQAILVLLSHLMSETSMSEVSSLPHFMDWASHLVDAHRNALRVSLRANNELTELSLTKVRESVRRIQELCDDLQEAEQTFKVLLGTGDRVEAPKQRLYWVENWSLLNKT